MKKSEILVIGRNWCNILTMSRALGEAGYIVDVLRLYKSKPGRFSVLGKMKPDAYSKYVNNFKECFVNAQEDKVVKILLESAKQNEKMLLLPVDDYTACIIDQHLEQLMPFYYIPNVDEKGSGIIELMDKNEQKKRALGSDVPMLKSVLVKSEQGKYEVPSEIIFPCFLKPNASINGTKAMMQKCNDRNELIKVLDKHAAMSDFEMLIEEYAEIKKEYSILGISTREKTIAPCMFCVLEGGNRERKGVSISGEIIETTPYKAIIDSCIKYVESLKYTGIFDIDLIETQSGEVYFIELNFRAGASTHAFTSIGVNLPGMFADYMLKGTLLPEHSEVQESGKTFVSEKILLEEFARTDASYSKVKRYVKETDICFIKDDKDPEPYRYFRKYYLIAALLRIPYRIKDLVK